MAIRIIGFPLLIILRLGAGLGAAFVSVQMMVFGVCMGAVFSPNNKGMPLTPKDSKIDFLSPYVLTSRNIRTQPDR